MDTEQITSDESTQQAPASAPGRGDLAAYIASRSYVPLAGSPSVNGEAGGNRGTAVTAPLAQGSTDPAAAGVQAGAAVPDPQASGQRPGVTTQPFAPTTPASAPDPRALEAIVGPLRQQIDALQQELRPLREEKLREQDRRFQATLAAKLEAGEITPDQAIAASREYERRRVAPLVQNLSARVQQTEQSENARAQAIAKNVVVMTTMLERGLPFEVMPLLHAAQTVEQFDQFVEILSGQIGPRQPAQPAQPAQQPEQPVDALTAAMQARAALAESGVLATFADDAGTPPPRLPERGSGDLDAYLATKSYQFAGI